MALLESEAFPSDIEKEANAIFSRIYDRDISMTDIILLLQAFKSSNDPRERKIFQCMIRSLYEEYPHIPKYPEKELHITGVLFGSLIQYQLVSYIPLVVALRYILEALKQPPNSKLFKFGLYALEQFMTRLHEWPQYCSHLRQIPQLQSFHPQLYRHIEAILASVPGGQQFANSQLPGNIHGGFPSGATPSAGVGVGILPHGHPISHNHALSGSFSSPDQAGHSDQQEAYEYRGEGFLARQPSRQSDGTPEQFPEEHHQQIMHQQLPTQSQQLRMSQAELAYVDPAYAAQLNAVDSALSSRQYGNPQPPDPEVCTVIAVVLISI